MNISLLYTSARPHLILGLLNIWKTRSMHWENVEVVLVTDEAFEESFEDHFPNMSSYVNSGRRDCVTGWNLAASKASGDMFIQVSDDLFPPEQWDEKLIAMAGEAEYFSLQLPDQRGLRDCVLHPVISRTVYQHFGYLYPPDFKSVYCDDWLYYAHRQAGFLHSVEAGQFWNHMNRATHDVVIDDVLLRHESLERYAEGYEVFVRELEKLGMRINRSPKKN
jgi:hypothetical protein